jgi:hypothetical protein
MAQDPAMALVDIQWILGHVNLSTTQIYLTPVAEDAIAAARAHHARAASPQTGDPVEQAAGGYRAESLDVLFGRNV